ncbi:MAG: hypothetical protein HY706_09610 [Candidatus Hydrogenedentes bacterium]|nr:hypothetical protein [Candidatus Hydrogenedentota bacterium]
MSRRRLIAIPVIALAFACTVSAQWRMDTLRTAASGEELPYLPNELMMNHFTAGLSGVVADVLWLKCIQYISTHFWSDYRFVYLNDLCKMVTRLDPYFHDAYRYGGMFLAAFKADEDASVELFRSGMAHLPDRWELPFEAAMVYLLNRRDQPDSPKLAAAYLSMAVATGQAPEMVVRVAEGIQWKHNLTDIERDMWQEIVRTNPDKIMREMAQRKLVELDLREVCDVMDRAGERFKTEQGRPVTSLDDLVRMGYVTSLPTDPLGGHFILDSQGRVKSTTLLDEDVKRRKNRLRALLDAFNRKEGRPAENLDELVRKGYTRRILEHPYEDQRWRYDPRTGEIE